MIRYEYIQRDKESYTVYEFADEILIAVYKAYYSDIRGIKCFAAYPDKLITPCKAAPFCRKQILLSECKRRSPAQNQRPDADRKAIAKESAEVWSIKGNTHSVSSQIKLPI